MTWALTQRFVTDPSARHVLLCLANYADKDGVGAFPSAASLSDDTGLAVRTVRYKLEQLKEAGVIRLGNQAIAAAYIDRGDRRPVVYDLAMERGAADALRLQRCANRAPRNAERGAPVAPNPSLNHQGSVNDPREERAPFALDLEWQPDPKRLKAVAFAAGVSVEACVEVPVQIPCRTERVLRPVFAVDVLPIGASIDEQMRADRRQRQGYEARLEAVVEACR